MNLMDTPAFASALAKMALVFNAKPVTDELVEVWMESLSDVPWSKVAPALEEHQRHGKFWPRPGAIRALIDRASVSQVPAKKLMADDPTAPPQCEECEDSGWVQALQCPGDGTCGHRICRGGMYHAHTFTRPCRCRQTNPVFQAGLRRTYHREDAA